MPHLESNSKQNFFHYYNIIFSNELSLFCASNSSALWSAKILFIAIIYPSWDPFLYSQSFYWQKSFRWTRNTRYGPVLKKTLTNGPGNAVTFYEQTDHVDWERVNKMEILITECFKRLYVSLGCRCPNVLTHSLEVVDTFNVLAERNKRICKICFQ